MVMDPDLLFLSLVKIVYILLRCSIPFSTQIPIYRVDVIRSLVYSSVITKWKGTPTNSSQVLTVGSVVVMGIYL